MIPKEVKEAVQEYIINCLKNPACPSDKIELVPELIRTTFEFKPLSR